MMKCSRGLAFALKFPLDPNCLIVLQADGFYAGRCG